MEFSSYILNEEFSKHFPLLSQEEIGEIINRAVEMGNIVTKARNAKTVCPNCSGTLTFSEIIEIANSLKKSCIKCTLLGVKKIILEEYSEKMSLEECLQSLKLTPKELIDSYNVFITTENGNNIVKKYTFNDKRYEIICKRQLMPFSHTFKITVYTFEE